MTKKRKKIRQLVENRRYTKKARIFGLNIPLFMLPFLIFFVLSTVFVTIEVATSGAKLAKLEKEKISLARENEEIKEKLINGSSLTKLGDKAKEMGFDKPLGIIYVTEKEALAKLP